NLKINVDGKINKYISAGMSVNFSLTETERGSDDAVRNGFNMAPIFKPYDAAGNPIFRPGQILDPGTNTVSSFTSTVNPLLEIENTQNNTRRKYGVGNFYVQVSPVDWLDFRSTFSPGVNFTRNGRFWGSLTGVGDGLLPDAQRINQQTLSYILDNMVTIRK